jgi:hypothetical protein
MTQKVIFPENMFGEGSRSFQRLMELVPAKDRADIKLKRFLVFRMKIDGEEATRTFLLNGIEHARESAFNGTLYDYLVDHEAILSRGGMDSLPPDEPG